MLQLRPCCENCAKVLAPASGEAMICSFECTFCKDCVSALDNFCPNCGGGFAPRPIRPSRNLCNENYLGKYPASAKSVVKPVDWESHKRLVKQFEKLPPSER